MAKVLKEGQVKADTSHDPWYRGKKFTCKNCGCEFENESGDNVHKDDSHGRWATGAIGMTCPTCKSEVWLERTRTDG